MRSIRSQSTDQLFEAIMNLETLDECYDFFSDLCTVNEIKSMSQRFEVAMALDEGMNYQEIENSIDVSSGTISRIRRAFDYGSGGYSTVITRMKQKKRKIREDQTDDSI